MNVTEFSVVNVHVDELTSPRIWQHILCATFSANVNINYRLSMKVYYRICTLRHIGIEITFHSYNFFLRTEICIQLPNIYDNIHSIYRNILLNYAVANPKLGYTQGMSDLLAPVLAEIQHEADAYWCFVGLMQRTIFVSSPKDNDMDKQLVCSLYDKRVSVV